MFPKRQARPGWGALIRDARLSRGLSQEELAETIGMDNSRVSRLENEMLTPRLDDIHALCVGLDIWPERLLTELGLVLTPSAASLLPRELVDAALEMSPEAQRLLSGVANSLRQTYPRTGSPTPADGSRASARQSP